MSLFIHLVYNGDMKADVNSLVCIEKGKLGWFGLVAKGKKALQKSKDKFI